MYGLPLVVITFSYILILREICIKTKQSKEELKSSSANGRLRRSAVGNIEKAMSRTLKMTIIIVGAFVFCWTPYYVIAVWWWFDRYVAMFFNGAHPIDADDAAASPINIFLVQTYIFALRICVSVLKKVID